MEQYRQEQSARRYQAASRPFRPPTMAHPAAPVDAIDLTGESPLSSNKGVPVPRSSSNSMYPRLVDIRPKDKHSRPTTIKVLDDDVPARRPDAAPRPPNQQAPPLLGQARPGPSTTHQRPPLAAVKQIMNQLHLPSSLTQPLEKFAEDHLGRAQQNVFGSKPSAVNQPFKPHSVDPYAQSSVNSGAWYDENNTPVGMLPTMDAAERDRQLQEMISNMVDLSDVDPARSRIEGLKCELMPHQIQGVDWMVQREKGKDKCGLLADDMGLGKTIQTLALIVSNRPSLETSTIKYIEEAPEVKKGKKAVPKENEEPPAKREVELKSNTTLILAPLAVIKQWENEIHEKSNCGLKVYVHHGTARAKTSAILKKYDVVITTYTTAAAEWGNTLEGQRWAEKRGKSKTKRKSARSLSDSEDDDSDDSDGESDQLDSEDDSDDVIRAPGRSKPPKVKVPAKAPAKKKAKPPTPLFDGYWLRIVLDEAQNIKNHRTKSALASFALGRKSHSRWCLTGTPIQNNAYELYSMIHFMGIPPFNEYPHFKEKIGEPLKSLNQNRVNFGLRRLRIVLGAIMLRRTKDAMHDGKKILQLPPREVEVVQTDFDDPEEREFYTSLEERMRETLKKNEKVNHVGALVMLLRLRQACSHPALTMKNIVLDSAAANSAPAAQSQVTGGSSSRGSGVGDGDGDEDDLVNALAGLSVTKTCDMCRTPLEEAARIRCSQCEGAVARSNAAGRDWLKPMKLSTKIRLMMQKLQEIQKESPNEKTIVFSQFTSFLDLVQPFLDEAGLQHVRYDGAMRPEAREKALQTIKTSDTCKIILISFKAGSTGLNLTCCSRVLLMDLWWNPQIEEQAFDRAHRLGQNRPVYIYKLSVKNSVEERLLTIQQKKRDLANSALTGEKYVKGGKQKLSWQDLLYLFNAN